MPQSPSKPQASACFAWATSCAAGCGANTPQYRFPLIAIANPFVPICPVGLIMFQSQANNILAIYSFTPVTMLQYPNVGFASIFVKPASSSI